MKRSTRKLQHLIKEEHKSSNPASSQQSSSKNPVSHLSGQAHKTLPEEQPEPALPPQTTLGVNPLFGYIVLLIIISATLLYIRYSIQEAWAGRGELLQGVGNIAMATVQVTHKKLSNRSDSATDIGVQASGIIGTVVLSTKGFLCRTKYGSQAIERMGVSCSPTLLANEVLDILDKTAFTVGKWANASTGLMHHSDYLKTANIAAGIQQSMIKWNNANFTGKESLDRTINLYGEGLFRSGSGIYAAMSETERILILMLDHFIFVDAQLQKINGDEHDGALWIWSWHRTHQIKTVLTELLEYLSISLVELIRFIVDIESTLQDTQAHADLYGSQVNSARRDVQQQISDQGRWFKHFETNSPLHKMESLLVVLGAATNPGDSLANVTYQLQTAKHSLDDLRINLRGVLMNIAGMRSISLDLTLRRFQSNIAQLASTRANMEFQRARERVRREKERKGGIYSHPDGGNP